MLTAIQMEHFLRDADKALSALDSFLKRPSSATEALKSYVTSIHSVKSLLRSIGEKELADIAAGLEDAGRKAALQTITSQTPPLLARFRPIVEPIRSQVSKRINEDDAGTEDVAFLRTQLAAIKAACEVYNKRGAESAIDALKKKPCSRATKQFLSEIDLFLLRGDFEEAATLANKISMKL